MRRDYPKALTGYLKDKKKFAGRIYSTNPTSVAIDEVDKYYKLVYGFADNFDYTSFQLFPYPEREAFDILTKPIISGSDTVFANFVSTLGNLKWVSEGHRLYHDKAGGICPYCQRPIDYDFESELRACYDEQYKNDINELRHFYDYYEKWANEIKRIGEANLHLGFSSLSVKKYYFRFDTLLKINERNLETIKSKIDDPDCTVELPNIFEYVAELNRFTDVINGELAEYTDVLANISTHRKQCEELVWGYMAKECEELSLYHREESEKNSQKKSAANEELAALTREIGEKKQEIITLSESTVDTSKAMRDINTALEHAGFRGFFLREKPDAD